MSETNHPPRPTLSARVDPETRKFFERLARSERRSVSSVVNMALAEWRAHCAQSIGEQRVAP
jgi:predicted transcriptional regulator